MFVVVWIHLVKYRQKYTYCNQILFRFNGMQGQVVRSPIYTTVVPLASYLR